MDKDNAHYEHQSKSAAEVAKLVLPEGEDASIVGTIPDEKVDNTIDIALTYGIITQNTDKDTVFDHSIMEDVLAAE